MAQVEKCSVCNGKGFVTCPICNGHGVIKKAVSFSLDFKVPESVECQTCQGTGRRLCKACDGAGKLLLEKPKSPWA